MVKLIWTDQTLNDINDIGDYIALKLEKYAKLTIKKLLEKTNILITFPKSGRKINELTSI